MKYFIVAGERSGDQHGSHLTRHLFQIDKEAVIQGWGGDQLKEAGVEVLTHYNAFSLMGVWDVVRNIPSVFTYLNKCKKDILDFSPDVLVLIDFPGFNLRLAQFAKKRRIKVCYYIPPKVWAWNARRVKKLKRSVDQLLVIFPFEVEFYKRNGVNAMYVGNPTQERTTSIVKNLSKQESDRIAFLPGSRLPEVRSAVRVIKQLASDCPEYFFQVSKVSNVDWKEYQCLEDIRNVTVTEDALWKVLSGAKAAIVTSGTATLEVALMGVPQLVVYKTNWLNYRIARIVINIRFISLVNIILDRQIVKELIQKDYSADRIELELISLLNDQAQQKKISEGYSEIHGILKGLPASQNAATAVFRLSRS